MLSSTPYLILSQLTHLLPDYGELTEQTYPGNYL